MGQKKLAVGFKRMSIKLRRQEKYEQIRTATEKIKHRLIFSREFFYVTVVLCLNIL